MNTKDAARYSTHIDALANTCGVLLGSIGHLRVSVLVLPALILPGFTSCNEVRLERNEGYNAGPAHNEQHAAHSLLARQRRCHEREAFMDE